MHQHATLEDTVYFWFAANDTSGSGGDGASPLYDVRLAGAASDAAPVLSGSATLLSHADYPAGCHEVAVAATAVNGFAAASTYGVFCTLAVDSQNPTGFVGSFTLGPIPANVTKWGGTAIGSAISAANLAKLEDMLDGTGGQTLTLEQLHIVHADGPGIYLDVATANGAIDIDNSSGPGISINVAEADGIAITTSTSGDGISITAADDVAPELVTAINATVETALEDIGLDHLISVAAAEDEVADNSVIARLAATEGDWSEFNDENHSLEALRVRGDAAWATATSVTVSDKTGFSLSAAGVNAVADQVWDEAIAGHTTGTTFGGKNQKAVPSETIGDYKATGFSTHDAADVKTAIEADGSKLDHLWEMTEDDAGTRRLTTNALEQAPSGGLSASEVRDAVGLASANLDTQLSGISDVTDKVDTMLVLDGAVYDFTTAALAAAPSGTTQVTFTPVAVTVSAGAITDNAITQYQHAAFGPFLFTILDSDDNAVDLSAAALTFAVYKVGEPDTILWSLTSGAGEITVAGDSNNEVTVEDDDTNTATAGIFRYVLWDTTNDLVRARGTLTIEDEADSS